MDINQAADLYDTQVRGFNLGSGTPTSEMTTQAMQSLVKIAAQADLPADGKFKHLDEIVATVAEVAPQSAEMFNRYIINNPSQKEFAKTLEVAFTIMEKRSPETWKHIKRHGALTMLDYERQIGPNGPANIPELLTLFVGAIGHDVGKVGLDPELLHKSTRVVPKRFSEALQNFNRLVPDYPEKLHDSIFLEEANMGHVLFAEPGKTAAPAAGAGPVMIDIGKDMRRSESYWVDDAERQKYNAIWERINAKAQQFVVPQPPHGWLDDREQKALTMSRRGTVTQDERNVIQSHDPMSEAFFKAAPLAPELNGVRDIVSMEGFHAGTVARTGLLADIIHTTDIFETITGDRSYRKPYTLEEAEKVMHGMAKDGAKSVDGQVKSAILGSLEDNGTLEIFANKFGLQHSDDLKKPEQQQAVTGDAAPQLSGTLSVNAKGELVSSDVSFVQKIIQERAVTSRMAVQK